MTQRELIGFFPWLPQYGLRPNEYIGGFENATHRVAIQLMDYYSTVSFKISLLERDNVWVDAYSVIDLFSGDDLAAFLSRDAALSDEDVAAFISDCIGRIGGRLFSVVNTDDWAVLVEFHKNSVGRRNSCFWEKVSGLTNRVIRLDEICW